MSDIATLKVELSYRNRGFANVAALSLKGLYPRHGNVTLAKVAIGNAKASNRGEAYDTM